MKYVRLLSFSLLALIALSFNSCVNSSETFSQLDQLQNEIAAIDARIAGSSDLIIKDPSGVRMVVTKLGEGLPALSSDLVTIDYVGRRFSDDFNFESQTNVQLTLNQLIAGWQIAFTKLPQGTEATLYIPSFYGYGSRAIKDVPPNSSLIFEVKFKKAAHTPNVQAKIKQDTIAIDQYLAAKNITAIKDTTGLRYVVNTVGTGPVPSWLNVIKMTISYKLITNDQRTLITVNSEPSETFFSRVIDYLPAIRAAVLKLPEGSKATLYVPSDLGFGARGAADSSGQVIIPANSVLIIDIELKDVE